MDTIREQPTLRPYQEPCVQGILDLWEENLPAILTAQTGSGKTYMATMVSYLYGAEYVVVVGPKSSLTKWREVLSSVFPIENIFCCSYEAWRGCGTREIPNQNQPYTYKIQSQRNDLLGRYQEGYRSAYDEQGYDFEASDLWNILVWEHKTIFILDEFHKLQKQSQRTFSIACNTRNILRYKCPSRVLALSFTPCDNIVDIPNHMYLFGMTPDRYLAEYDRRTMRYNTSGLEQVLVLAKSFEKVDPKDVQEITKMKYVVGKSMAHKINKLAGKLFLKYIRKHLVFSCVPDFVRNTELIPVYTNYFCKVSDKSNKIIDTIINDGGVEQESPHIDFIHTIKDTSDMAILTKIQKNIEKIKVTLYEELAKEWLTIHPTGKVAIMVLFLDSMDYLCESLSQYNPTRIEGCMSGNMRDTSINMFQAHNTDSQVIIATITTGGEAIDLHDTSPDGSFPRLIIIPPTFYTKNMVQASGRVFRDSVTSRPTIKIVYTIGQNQPESSEKRFIDSVRRKTTTIKEYHADKQDSILPCNYDNIVSEKVYQTIIDNPK